MTPANAQVWINGADAGLTLRLQWEIAIIENLCMIVLRMGLFLSRGRTTMQRGSRWLLLAPAVLLCAALQSSSAIATDCMDRQRSAGDAELRLNSRDKNQSIKANVLGGLPDSPQATSGEIVLVQRDYVTRYDGDLLMPLWVTYRLDQTKLDKVARVDCFRPDVRLRADRSAQKSDYDDPIYDQGHMAPAADMSGSVKSMINSTIFSNVEPQRCHFNRGIWLVLESLTRHWLKESGVLYVATGAVFDRNGDGKRDKDSDAKRMKSRNDQRRVAVPTTFYKIFAWETDDGGWETLSILLTHDNKARAKDKIVAELKTRVVKLKDIERVSGIKWFPSLAAVPQEATELWPVDGFNPTTLDSRCE